ncbi:MAG: pentapeptide repeat-containing protein [Cyanobacteria bacterium J06638_22]
MQQSRAKLQKANLVRVKLQGANLIEADLQEANLVGVKLQGANLRRAKLQGANLMEADLQEANLFEANLENIKFDSQTQWPAQDKIAKAVNIPEALRQQFQIEQEASAPSEPQQPSEE